MIQIFDQLPMPPSENESYATDFHTKRRFETKELHQYKDRMKAWSFRRWEEVHEISQKLKWELADHRKMVRVDAYFFFQGEKLFTKTKTKKDSPRRKKMDPSNKCKALYDALANMLGVDDSRFLPGVAEPIIREEDQGQYAIVVLSLALIKMESEAREEIFHSTGISLEPKMQIAEN